MNLHETLQEIRRNPRRFYAYIMRTANGIAHYVGKGKGRRIAIHEAEAAVTTSTYKTAVIRHHTYAGLEMNYEIHGFFDTPEEAYRREAQLIRYFGRRDNGTGILANLDDGGTGIPNVGPGTRAKMRAAKLGKKQTEEHIKRNADARRGQKHTPERIEKIKMKNTGQVRTDLTCKRQRQAKLGKILTAEHRANLNIAHKRRWVSPDESATIDLQIILMHEQRKSQRDMAHALELTASAVNRRMKRLRTEHRIS